MLDRRTVWRLAKTVVFCVAIVAALSALAFVVTPSRGTTDPWPAVVATRNEADVLALGSSRTFCAIMPMEMWRDAGVTVLDVTGPVQPFSVTRAYLQQTFAYQRPKVVLLELYMMGRQDPFDMTRVHSNLDSMPGGVLRTETILQSVRPTGWFEALVPLQLYHSRWTELTQRDFQLNKFSRYAFARGAKYVPGAVSIPATVTDVGVNEDGYKRDLAYVRDMARMCDEHGARLVLFSSPSPRQGVIDGQPLQARLKADLSSEFPSVRYLDTNSVVATLGIDPKSDYKDVLHLDQKGAVKLSRWLAGYLVREYGIADHRRDAFASSWNDSLNLYDKAFKAN